MKFQTRMGTDILVKDITISKSNGFYVEYIKVMLDVLISLVIFIVTLPVLIIIAILIKLDSKGPIIFKQIRIGKDGKEFTIYKFRTMYVNTPIEAISPTSEFDPRITKIGRFIRNTSLDEIPQIFNILKGDMSFVGPRPEQRSIVEKNYRAFERQRFLVKPGITGLWQLSIYRTKPIHENLHYDFEYIRNVSFICDVKIIIQTVMIMIRSNTY